MRNILLSIILLLAVSMLCCDSSDNGNDGDQQPSLTSISPTTKAAHMPAFTLTANGSNFVSGSKIVFNGQEKQTTFISSTQLTCEIDPADTVTTGLPASDGLGAVNDTTTPVLVRNPAPGGDSNTVDFTILSEPAFDNPVAVYENHSNSIYQDIAVTEDSQQVYTVWTNPSGSQNFDIYASNSDDGGKTWDDPVNISNNSGTSTETRVATDEDGTAYTVWTDNSAGNYQIYSSTSSTDGSSWSTPTQVSNQPGTFPLVDTYGKGKLCIAWMGINGILFSNSTNSGSTWSAPKIINPAYLSVFNIPDLAVDDNGVFHVVFSGFYKAAWGIYYTRSSNNGITWITPMTVTKTGNNIPAAPQIIISNAIIYVFWVEVTPSSIHAVQNLIDPSNKLFERPMQSDPGANLSSLRFSKSTNNGTSWSAPVTLHNFNFPAIIDLFTSVAVDGAGNLNLLTWDIQQNGTIYDIEYTRSIDNGNNWTSIKRIFTNPLGALAPRLTVDSEGNIYTVFKRIAIGGFKTYFGRSLE